MSQGSPRKIVIRAPNWLGDHVMALPFYRAIRNHYPDASLTLFAAPAVSGLGRLGVFDEVLEFDRKEGVWSGARKLSGYHFDFAITLPASLSSALVLRLARIPVRVGFAAGGSGALLTASLPWLGRSAGVHKGDLYLRLAEWLTGAPVAAESIAEQEGSAREPLIVVAPGASLPLREWPGFLELLPRLRKFYPDYRVVVVGTDDKWASQLKRLGDPGIENWIGQTSLLELTDLFSRAMLVVANDSGPAHLAAHYGAAVVVVFGPGDPRYVVPRGSRVFVVREESVACSPCESARCARPFGYQACLRAVDTNSVFSAVSKVLTPAPSRA